MNRAGVPSGRAVFIGDSVWTRRRVDGPAWPASECSAAGSRAEDLTAGGARVVFEDTRELTERIADTPIAELL